MLITEKTLQSAIEVFLKEAHIPRPQGWSVNMDTALINHVIVPAFFKALHEIEDVSPCYGFDLKNVKPNQQEV